MLVSSVVNNSCQHRRAEQPVLYSLLLPKAWEKLGSRMKLSQEAKSLLAVMALVGAVAAGLNAVLPLEAQRGDAAWAIILLALALLMALWMRRDALPTDDDSAAAADDAADQAEDFAKRVIIRRESEPTQDADEPE